MTVRVSLLVGGLLVVSLLGAMISAPTVAEESTANEEGHVTLVLQVCKFGSAGEGAAGKALMPNADQRVDVEVEGAWVSGKTDKYGQVEFSLKPDLYLIRFYHSGVLFHRHAYDEVMVDITSIPAGRTYQYLYVV
jgi:hypothetical protein